MSKSKSIDDYWDKIQRNREKADAMCRKPFKPVNRGELPKLPAKIRKLQGGAACVPADERALGEAEL